MAKLTNKLRVLLVVVEVDRKSNRSIKKKEQKKLRIRERNNQKKSENSLKLIQIDTKGRTVVKIVVCILFAFIIFFSGLLEVVVEKWDILEPFFYLLDIISFLLFIKVS